MIFNVYETLLLACGVLLLGRILVKKIEILNKYNIPEPVVGGFIVAIIAWIYYSITGAEFYINEEFQNAMMLVFFSSIGLNADFAKLVKGGRALFIFILICAVFIICQNTIGVGLASLLGLDTRFGLIAGSVTLTGGHGTAGGWADTFLNTSNPLLGAREIGMACATFGLIFGGIIGGPLAFRLLKKNNYKELTPEELERQEETHEISDEAYTNKRVTYRSIFDTIVMIAICMVSGKLLSDWNSQYAFKLPTFVWSLFIGVIIRNFITHAAKKSVDNESVDIVGNIGLSLFLAMALMSLKLWMIVDLALPILVILVVQVIFMLLYAGYITYRVMGKDYDAIVLSAGHCGFGLGATATAMANIQAVTNRFGYSFKSFLIIPIVGAFFIDIINALILNVFVYLLS